MGVVWLSAVKHYHTDTEYSGTSGCPVHRGVSDSEIDLYTVLRGWTACSVLIREVSLFGVLFVERFHCPHVHISNTKASFVPPEGN